LGVTNSAWAISRLLCPVAASSAISPRLARRGPQAIHDPRLAAGVAEQEVRGD
jgi:hypothetical protein